MTTKTWAARTKDIMKFSLLVLLAALVFSVWAVLTVEDVSHDCDRWAAVVGGGNT